MHFTYKDPPDKSALNQGDVLERTDALNAVLEEVHPHYHDKPDYRFFMVLTQTCDLVPRGGGCAARYITIAAVRPFMLAVGRYVEGLQYDPLEQKLGFCDLSRQAKLSQFIERLLNNNEDDYFYLHGEPSAGFTQDHCAFLHLSIALKADQHYQTLLAAKRLQLQDTFQHKLGSIVGQIYSRIGTEDWVPNTLSKGGFRREVQNRVDSLKSVLWLEKSIHKQVLSGLKKLPESEQTLKKVEELVAEAHKGRQERMQTLLDLIENEAVALSIDAGVAQKLKNRVRSKPELKGIVK